MNSKKICPSCGQKIDTGDTHCRLCQQQFVRCNSCGREIGAGAGFCNFCGSKLTGREAAAAPVHAAGGYSGDEQPPTPDKTPKPSRLRWVIFLILILAIGGVGYFACTHTLVKAPSGYALLKNDSCSFNEVYLDITSWELLELFRHEKVRRAILDKEIPDFNGTRLKLAALQGVDNVVPDAANTILEAIDKKAKETSDMLEAFSNDMLRHQEDR